MPSPRVERKTAEMPAVKSIADSEERCETSKHIIKGRRNCFCFCLIADDETRSTFLGSCGFQTFDDSAWESGQSNMKKMSWEVDEDCLRWGLGVAEKLLGMPLNFLKGWGLPHNQLGLIWLLSVNANWHPRSCQLRLNSHELQTSHL